MTILFSDGFDYYQTTTGAGSQNITLASRYSVPGDLTTYTYNTGYNNEGKCITFAATASANNSALLPVTELLPNFTMGAHIFFTGFPSSRSSIFNAYTPANRYLTLSFENDTTRQLTVASSSSAFFMPSTTFNIPTSTWVYVEMNVQQTATPNISLVSVYINNTLVASSTIAVSLAGTPNTFGRFHIGKFTDGTTNSFSMDNLYLSSGEILGATQIRSIYPSADTAQKNGLPSSGSSNYLMVNDSTAPTMDSSVTFISENAKDVYALDDVLNTNANDKILAIQAISFGQSSSASPSATLTPTVISSSTESTQSGRIMDTGVALAAASPHYNKNPSGNVDWTQTSVNALTVANKANFPTQYSNVVYSIVNNNVINLTGSTPTEPVSILKFGNAIGFGISSYSYTKTAALKVSAPYSIEFEFSAFTVSTAQVILGVGTLAAPELLFRIDTAGQLQVLTSGSNGTVTTISYLNPIVDGTWYKIGCMVYIDGIQTRIRGYLNGAQVFDQAIPQPISSTSNFRVGGGNDSNTQFYGFVRNLYMGQSYFWNPGTTATDNRTNSMFTIGSGGAISNSTASSLVAGDTPPTVSGDALVFNGSQRLRYTDSSLWHVTAPYSVEFEVMLDQIPATNQWVFTIGEAFGVGNGELTFMAVASTGQLRAYTVSANSGGTQTVGNYNTTSVTNTWYKLGFMYYNDGTNNRIRGYLNNNQVFDVVGTAIFDSTNGAALGNDNVVQSTQVRNFYGKIRNFYLAHYQFWPL